MRDFDVRSALKAGALKAHAGQPDTLVLDEFGLEHGQVFVDVAVINGEIHGYELKSDRDTLERLPHQVVAYSAALDRATLVVGERHYARVTSLIPEWWGLAVAVQESTNRVNVELVRNGSHNPTPAPASIARLLWRDEALALLEAVGEARGVRSKPRRFLYERLVAVLDLEALRLAVRKQLKHRKGWRSDSPRM